MRKANRRKKGNFPKWDTSALIALLLFRLKYLRSVCLRYEYWPDWKYLEKIYARSLQNLEIMVFDTWDNTTDGRGTVHAINTTQSRYLLSLQKIRLISGLSVDDQEEDDDSELFENICRNPLVLHLTKSPLKLSIYAIS
jgi:hypothetical protein